MEAEQIGKLFVEIITPEAKIFAGEAESILFPGADGDIFVLPSHLPLVCVLREGNLLINLSDEEKKEFSLFGGILEVDNDKVKIISSKAEEKETAKV